MFVVTLRASTINETTDMIMRSMLLLFLVSTYFILLKSNGALQFMTNFLSLLYVKHGLYYQVIKSRGHKKLLINIYPTTSNLPFKYLPISNNITID